MKSYTTLSESLILSVLQKKLHLSVPACIYLFLCKIKVPLSYTEDTNDNQNILMFILQHIYIYIYI